MQNVYSPLYTSKSITFYSVCPFHGFHRKLVACKAIKFQLCSPLLWHTLENVVNPWDMSASNYMFVEELEQQLNPYSSCFYTV